MQTPIENFDPLLECLLHFCKIHDVTVSKEGLRADLPLENNRLTPSLFVRAADKVNLNAKIIKRPLEKTSSLLTPLVLILHDNSACILQKIHDDKTYEILLPETGDIVIHKSFEELKEMYSGFAILVQPYKFKEKEALSTHPKSWFWGTILHFKKNYIQVMLAAFFINLFTLASPLFIMNVYDRVVPNNATLTLWVLTIGICIIFIFDMILKFLRAYLIDVTGKKADTLMASYIFQHIMGMSLIYKPKSIGAFVNHIRDFESIRDFFTSATIIGFIDIPFILLFILFIWYLGSYLVFIPLLTIPLMVLISWWSVKPTRKYISQVVQANSEKNAVLIESLTGIEMIKSLVAEGILQRKWENITSLINSANIKAKFINNTASTLSGFLQHLTTIFIIVAGVYLIEDHQMTLGGLIACSILNGRTLAPISQLISLISRYQQSRLSLKNLEQIMEMPTERSEEKEYIQHHDIKGDIVFSDVSFQYPAQEQLALNHINIKIKQGEHVGIVGRIGSGKTTLHKLILTLYHPKEGQITLDDIDITQLDPANLRKQIGYAPQDASLFSGTLRDNILLGNSEVSDDHMLEIAKITGAEKIAKLSSSGFHLKIGDRGEGLSGGQKQSIALARALVGHPKIVLFDEPTSSMDEQSEKELIGSLKTYIQDKTFIVSTHRALLLSLVDRIIVLDHGKIVYDGPKEKVLQPMKPKAS